MSPEMNILQLSIRREHLLTLTSGHSLLANKANTTFASFFSYAFAFDFVTVNIDMQNKCVGDEPPPLDNEPGTGFTHIANSTGNRAEFIVEGDMRTF